MIRPILWAMILASGIALGAEPYKLEHMIKVGGSYFFTPAAGSATMAAFGYVGKVRPTPREIEAERKRIRAVIENGIVREYGSWENYKKQMEQVGKSVAHHAEKKKFDWAKKLMPPSLIEKAIPALLGGALISAMAHPENQSRPFGNLGETGVVLVDAKGKVHKVPLGIDQPVRSLAFSPGGRYLAALSDLGGKKKRGRRQIAGRLSVIDPKSRKVLHEWILAYAVGEVRFSPDGRRLGFLLQDPDEPSRKALRFIDTRNWRIEPRVFLFDSFDSRGIHFGKAYQNTHFRFCCGGKAVALATRRGIECRRISDGGVLYRMSGRLESFATASKHPWIFDAQGRLFDCQAKSKRVEIPGHRGGVLNYVQVAFVDEDRAVIAAPRLGPLERIDTQKGSVRRAQGRGRARGGLFILTPKGRYLAVFRSLPEAASVRCGPLRRPRVGLHLFETRSLRYLGALRPPPEDTFLDGAATESRIIVGGMRRLYLFRR